LEAKPTSCESKRISPLRSHLSSLFYSPLSTCNLEKKKPPGWEMDEHTTTLPSRPRQTQNGYTEDALPEGQYIDEESGAIYDAEGNVVDHLAAEDPQAENADEGEEYAGDAQHAQDEYGVDQQDVEYAGEQTYETGVHATGAEEGVEGEGEGVEGEYEEVEGEGVEGEGEGVEGEGVEGEEVEGEGVEGEGVEGEGEGVEGEEVEGEYEGVEGEGVEGDGVEGEEVEGEEVEGEGEGVEGEEVEGEEGVAGEEAAEDVEKNEVQEEDEDDEFPEDWGDLANESDCSYDDDDDEDQEYEEDPDAPSLHVE
jgi:hypothetical protein